jgi:hypothetical protein
MTSPRSNAAYRQGQIRCLQNARQVHLGDKKKLKEDKLKVQACVKLPTLFERGVTHMAMQCRPQLSNSSQITHGICMLSTILAIDRHCVSLWAIFESPTTGCRGRQRKTCIAKPSTRRGPYNNVAGSCVQLPKSPRASPWGMIIPSRKAAGFGWSLTVHCKQPHPNFGNILVPMTYSRV